MNGIPSHIRSGILEEYARSNKLVKRPIVASSSSNYLHHRYSDVLDFLDTYFKTGVDIDPSNSKYRYMDLTWTSLYTTVYLDKCKELKIVPLSYAVFVAVRKEFRPHYRRSRRIGKTGWDHLRCEDCERLGREIRRHQRGSAEEKSAEKLFKDHLLLQYACR
jgi:hypothetical protein